MKYKLLLHCNTSSCFNALQVVCCTASGCNSCLFCGRLRVLDVQYIVCTALISCVVVSCHPRLCLIAVFNVCVNNELRVKSRVYLANNTCLMMTMMMMFACCRGPVQQSSPLYCKLRFWKETFVCLFKLFSTVLRRILRHLD